MVCHQSKIPKYGKLDLMLNVLQMQEEMIAINILLYPACLWLSGIANSPPAIRRPPLWMPSDSSWVIWTCYFFGEGEGGGPCTKLMSCLLALLSLQPLTIPTPHHPPPIPVESCTKCSNRTRRSTAHIRAHCVLLLIGLTIFSQTPEKSKLWCHTKSDILHCIPMRRHIYFLNFLSVLLRLNKHFIVKDNSSQGLLWL